MASGTGRPESIEHVANVAICARGRSMFTRQREARRVVIECRARPLRGRMAGLAGLREFRSDVIRIGRRLIPRKMARGTCCSESAELSTNVAARTCGRCMLPCEWEPRRIVIERGSGPLRRRVAGFACLREARMARILRSLIVREVARRTRRSETSEFSAHVTTRACRRRVLPC